VKPSPHARSACAPPLALSRKQQLQLLSACSCIPEVLTARVRFLACIAARIVYAKRAPAATWRSLRYENGLGVQHGSPSEKRCALPRQARDKPPDEFKNVAVSPRTGVLRADAPRVRRERISRDWLPGQALCEPGQALQIDPQLLLPRDAVRLLNHVTKTPPVAFSQRKCEQLYPDKLGTTAKRTVEGKERKWVLSQDIRGHLAQGLAVVAQPNSGLRWTGWGRTSRRVRTFSSPSLCLCLRLSVCLCLSVCCLSVDIFIAWLARNTGCFYPDKLWTNYYPHR
jgi:hypothetical protein